MDAVVAWTVLSRCAASGVGWSCMPVPTTINTPPTPTYGADSHGYGLPLRSSTTHRLQQIVNWLWAQADTPLSPSFPCYL